MDHSATLVSIAHFLNEGSSIAAEQFNFLVVLCCVMLFLTATLLSFIMDNVGGFRDGPSKF
jgi:hypothetical protein